MKKRRSFQILVLSLRIVFLVAAFSVKRLDRNPRTKDGLVDRGRLLAHKQHQQVSTLPREPEDSNFGRQDYWNHLYESQSNFSWYAGWEELQPFIDEFLDHDQHVLIPGVGNDATLVDMYEDGYSYLTAMDYAPEGIQRCREMLGESRIRTIEEAGNGVNLVVADARDLKGVFEDHAFHAVIEKGTLDAIYLSGGHDKEQSMENLNLAISELGRCIKPGGTWISVTAVVIDQIQASFDARNSEWECLVEKEQLYMTKDGYTSNNIDGTLLVWRKRL